jgi:hypothetical protein
MLLVVARTDSGGLDHVADGESLDGLILGSASRAVGATDRLRVAAALLLYRAGRSVTVMLQLRLHTGKADS